MSFNFLFTNVILVVVYQYSGKLYRFIITRFHNLVIIDQKRQDIFEKTETSILRLLYIFSSTHKDSIQEYRYILE